MKVPDFNHLLEVGEPRGELGLDLNCFA